MRPAFAGVRASRGTSMRYWPPGLRGAEAEACVSAGNTGGADETGEVLLRSAGD